MNRRILIALAGSVGACLTLSSCSLGQGLYNVSLPGGADLGSHPYSVTAQFSNALNLVPQSGVKVNDVAVGKVTKISLEANGTIADVTVEVRGDVELPANAIASIQQTSLLGEKYVALSPPLSAPPTGRLSDGDTITLQHTTTGVEVEQVFGALSLLLNGGGIGQIKDITTELNKFATGHENQIRDFLANVTNVVAEMNKNKASITAALDALATLGATLKTKDSEIATILQELAPGVAVLADQRDQLITALNELNSLSTATVTTLDASKQNMIDDLKALAPILDQLAAAGSAFPKSLQVLATYPFTDGALSAIKGDYLNAFVTEHLNTPPGLLVTQSDLPTTLVPGNGPNTLARRNSPKAELASPPPTLLPATSSAAPGLAPTIVLTPKPSTSTSGPASGTPSGSGSTSGSGPSSPAASSPPADSSSPAGSSSPTGLLPPSGPATSSAGGN